MPDTDRLPKLDSGSTTVAIVVPTFSFTRLDRIKESIAAVLDNTLHADEIVIVVDNNQSLADYLTFLYRSEEIKVIESTGRGASAARNTAIDSLSTDIVVFLDDDVIPELTWLEAIVKTISLEGVAAVGGHILPDYDADARQLPAELLWLVGCTYAGHPMERVPITRPIGSTMAFRLHVLKEVGGFNSAFGPIGLKRVNSNEELPLSREIARQFGEGCIWFEPESLVKHLVPADRTDVRWILRRSWVEGRTKAAIRLTEDGSVMNYDKSYVVGTLIPRTIAYLATGTSSGLRFAGQMVLAGSTTALAFGWNRASTRLRSSPK